MNWTMNWIKIDKDNLPPYNEEVLGFSVFWVDEDYNPDGICACFLNDNDIWTVAVWNSETDQWDTCYTKDWYPEDYPHKDRHLIQAPSHFAHKLKPPKI